MKALMRKPLQILVQKDLRMLKPIIQASALSAGLLYLIVAGIFLRYAMSHTLFFPESADRGIPYPFYAMPIVCGAIGAMAFAKERREGWADLLATLPVSRQRIVITQLVVSAATCMALYAFIGVFILFITLLKEWERPADLYEFPIATERLLGWFRLGVYSGSTALATFGAAWFMSAIVRSPVIAVTVAIGVGCGGFFSRCDSLLAILYGVRYSHYDVTGEWIGAGAGLLLVAAGTHIQLLRQSP